MGPRFLRGRGNFNLPAVGTLQLDVSKTEEVGGVHGPVCISAKMEIVERASIS